ncbi:MAG: Spi family protease inhibitor, partial [Lentisphaeria bacterium]|nr:Spi family protease inhibitor [Lentisphaeria bacterium]
MLNTSKYLFLLLFFLLMLVRGASVNEADLRRAAANWLSGNVIFQQQSPSAAVERAEPVFSASQEALPLYVLHLRPAGYLVLTGDDTLPPVLAFSTQTQATSIPQRGASP